ncbi:leucine-rich repeat-containing protein 14-like isoform X2 [Oenanthe melanoleuca]|uniref:leucine-rich repeat-containing protein 14-like isoform X2 n=1 Tax=Oenanthe melanoleuca TaxID=2939378 RepID=UPI0024C13027|nr:leucine-rich repeat-containing protein 14-like isoform X2 [Oenanthe melanoleuca]
MPRNESEAPVRAEGELGLRSGGIPAISPNSHSPPESMDSLLLLCARRIVAQRPLPALPADLYPVLFQAAFLDGKPLVLQDLVATWPFPVLNLQRLVGRRELLPGHTCFKSVKAVIQAVVAQLCRELEKPGSHSSLRVLDMTMLPDSEFCHTPTGMKTWCSTRDLAEACVEVFKHQQEFQRCRSKHDKACSGADMATAALQCPGVDICADLSVIRWSYRMLRDALQIGAAGLLRLKCREFQVENISAPEIVTLLKSLDPSCLRRVDLCCNYFGLTGLSVILPHLSRFPELRSLKLQDNWLDVRHLTPKSGVTMRCVAQQLGMLPSLRELNLAISRLSGNLHQILCIHPPALKRLDLSGHDISQGLLEPLQLLLEKTSASLLYLDLTDCHMTDSHLNALLPTLLRCSRLRFLGLRINPLSLAALKDLLQKTLELPDLHVVVYPVPKDCCKRALPGFVSNFVIDRELLSAATAEISQLLANSWRTDLDWTCAPVGCKAMDYFLL